jgi:DNA-binding NarL/FixJ family response regulator
MANRGLSILLVDDDASFLLSVRRLLEEARGEELTVVATAANPEAALQAARRLKLEAVLVNPAMGASQGLDLIARLRELLPGSIVLALSASEDEAATQKAIAAGANGFVAKSRVKEQLLPELRRAMASRSSGSAQRS